MGALVSMRIPLTRRRQILSRPTRREPAIWIAIDSRHGEAVLAGVDGGGGDEKGPLSHANGC